MIFVDNIYFKDILLILSFLGAFVRLLDFISISPHKFRTTFFNFHKLAFFGFSAFSSIPFKAAK